MKIRSGYVSNSSTSSFLCAVCGEIGAGMDASASDFGMIECTRGHVFHEVHMTDETYPTREEILFGLPSFVKAWYLNAMGADWQEQLEDHQIDDLAREHGYPEWKCPICTFAETTDDDAIKYLLSVHKMTRKELNEEIRGKFKNYGEFMEWCRENS